MGYTAEDTEYTKKRNQNERPKNVGRKEWKGMQDE